MQLKDSETEKNLKHAFARSSSANLGYLYFADKADLEGYDDVSTVLRFAAKSKAGHAQGHLEYLESVGDPTRALPIGSTEDSLKAAIAGSSADVFPGMAKTALKEGFGDIADWFETLAKAARIHANRFQKALDSLDH